MSQFILEAVCSSTTEIESTQHLSGVSEDGFCISGSKMDESICG